MTAKLLLILFAGWLCAVTIQALQLVPERGSVEYFNPDFIEPVYLKVRRKYRGGPYVVHIFGVTKHLWNNNVTFDIVLFEYLHNEYKRTFVEFHFRVCDLLNNDPYVGKAVAKAGVSCPMKPGQYNLTNLSIPADDFPYVWPFERARAFGELKQHSTGIVIVNGSIYIHFIQKPTQKVNKNNN